MRPSLNLPPIDPRIRISVTGKEEIFDPIRKRYIRLTPEEWVRQHVIHLLIRHKRYPASLMAVEAPAVYNRMKKRSDIVVFGKTGRPLLLVECKAPSVPLTPEVFHQAAMYHAYFPGHWLMLTNGLSLFVCRVDHTTGSFRFSEDIPDYGDLDSH